MQGKKDAVVKLNAAKLKGKNGAVGQKDADKTVVIKMPTLKLNSKTGYFDDIVCKACQQPIKPPIYFYLNYPFHRACYSSSMNAVQKMTLLEKARQEAKEAIKSRE